MRFRIVALTTGVLAAAPSCSPAAHPPTGPHPHPAGSTPDPTGLAAFNPADQMFLMAMTPHHEQAIGHARHPRHAPMRGRALVSAAALLVGSVMLSGCATSGAPSGAPIEFGHVHGIVDLGGGTVLVGAHTGLYTLTSTGAVAGPVGGADFDAMGMAAADGALYASGHPGPATPPELGEHNLGIIRSTDGGTTWEPLAFTGEEDFHALTAGDGAIHGMGSTSNAIRTSLDGGATWMDGAELPAADLAVATDGVLYAATPDGVLESRDAGVTFAPVPGAPLVYLLEADQAGGLVGVGVDGALWRFTGASWDSLGAVSGVVQALGTTADGAIVLADDRGVVRIRGSEITVVVPAGSAP